MVDRNTPVADELASMISLGTDNLRQCRYLLTFIVTTGYSIMTMKREVGYINRFPAKLIYLNFHPLEDVSRCRDPQL